MMIKFENTSISDSVFHKVGNPILGGKLILSNAEIEFTEYSAKHLLNFYTSPFRIIKEVFQFENSVNLNLNEIYTICDQIFEGGKIVELSSAIAKHLFSQTKHSAIKSGEIFVGLLEEIVYEDSVCKGIVIIKSERKNSYIKVSQDGLNTLEITEGIQVDKADKACLILNLDYHLGFKVFSYEYNNVDTEYWRREFLSIRAINESMKQTSSLIGVCKEFSNEHILKNYGKKEQVEFLAKSINFISKSRLLDIGTFETSIIDREDDRNIFKNKLNEFIKNNEIQSDTIIKIAKEIVTAEKRKIKNEIKLDTYISIKLDPDNTLTSEKYIEQGFDIKRKMKFYKVYYNEEF